MAEPHRDEEQPREDDATAPMESADPGDDEKTIIEDRPPVAAWSGRAEVPEPATEYLRGGAPPYGRYPQAPAAEPRTWWTPVLLGVLALGLVGVVALAAWLLGRSARPEPSTPPVATTAGPVPTTAAPTTAAPPTPTASPSAQVVQIPTDLVGMTQAQAVQALRALGLGYQLQFAESDMPEGVVISSNPAAGEIVPVQATVTLVISLGSEPEPTPEPTTTP